MSFHELNLDPKLLRAVETSGYTTPTAIQSRAIPVALEGRDLLASAQTGTGKTAAFALPAIQHLLAPPKGAGAGRGPRVLVLTPTRELAAQVTKAIETYGNFTRLRTGVVVGGAPYPPQQRLLRNPLDFLVATPGRLIDHMQSNRVDFSRLELLILDEADRMLDMGFIKDVERIAAAAPADRQTLLFSATLDAKIDRVARRILRDPARVQVADVRDRHESIEQCVLAADNLRHKEILLAHLLQDPAVEQAIVFMKTKRGADRLAADLKSDSHRCAALHGDMTQRARNRTVEALRSGRVRVLVATDVAARGLDVAGISHVINFDLPMVAEDYVHRIGRTGRAGATGIAISLVGPQDWPLLAGIERLTGDRLERQVIPGLEPLRPEPRPGSKGKSGGGRKPGHPFARRNGSGRAGGKRGQGGGRKTYSAKSGAPGKTGKPRRAGGGKSKARG